MSYCVEYNPEFNCKYPRPKRRKCLPNKKVLYLLIFFVAMYVFVQGRAYRYLIPGNPEVTISAFSTMVEQVDEGAPIKDAFFTFCQEIIANGNR